MPNYTTSPNQAGSFPQTTFKKKKTCLFSVHHLSEQNEKETGEHANKPHDLPGYGHVEEDKDYAQLQGDLYACETEKTVSRSVRPWPGP